MALVLLASGVTAAGAGVGVALQQTGVFGGGGSTTVAALDTVPVVRCPRTDPIGVLRRGDRVLATGRTSDNAWVEIRDPRNLTARVWVARPVVIPDSALTGLPVHPCAIPTTTTTTAPAAAAPTTTTSTTRGSTGATAATAPPDTTGPTISGISLQYKTIYEAGANCVNLPTTDNVSASVSDPSGVASVTMSWQVSQSSGSKGMSGGPTYAAQLGPFGTSTIAGGTASITITITAKDTLGNPSTANTSVTLTNC